MANSSQLGQVLTLIFASILRSKFLKRYFVKFKNTTETRKHFDSLLELEVVLLFL